MDTKDLHHALCKAPSRSIIYLPFLWYSSRFRHSTRRRSLSKRGRVEVAKQYLHRFEIAAGLVNKTHGSSESWSAAVREKLKSFRYGKRTNALLCSQGTFSSWRLTSVEDSEEYVNTTPPLSMIILDMPILLLGKADCYSKISHGRRTNFKWTSSK